MVGKRDIEKEAYEKAIHVLEKCSAKKGFRAAYPGYNGVWARDSAITSLGASLLGKKFKAEFKNSLITLAKAQSKNGQIPNAVLLNAHKIDYQSIDSTLWFLIAHHYYKKRYGSFLFRKCKKNIKKALNWLSYFDMGEDGMLEQLPTTDWQDAFPHRYGHTINTQALYFKVLSIYHDGKKAQKLADVVNNNSGLRLWNGEFYYSYRWKNHRRYKEIGDWFDSLGNLLAIIFELADENKAKKILEYIKKNKINMPYPVKAIYPAIEKSSKYWQDYYLDCEAGRPNHYLNAGIWTYIGGFYVLALIKMKKFKEAQNELKKIAEVSLKYNFTEWLNGLTGKMGGSESGSQEGNQAWNAGMYILAYESLKRKKVLL
ncbi:MAG: glycoside hydrolase 100 family protein [Nanoarchaeota archaeon]